MTAIAIDDEQLMLYALGLVFIFLIINHFFKEIGLTLSENVARN